MQHSAVIVVFGWLYTWKNVWFERM